MRFLIKVLLFHNRDLQFIYLLMVKQFAERIYIWSPWKGRIVTLIYTKLSGGNVTAHHVHILGRFFGINDQHIDFIAFKVSDRYLIIEFFFLVVEHHIAWWNWRRLSWWCRGINTILTFWWWTYRWRDWWRLWRRRRLRGHLLQWLRWWGRRWLRKWWKSFISFFHICEISYECFEELLPTLLAHLDECADIMKARFFYTLSVALPLPVLFADWSRLMHGNV